MTNEKRSIINIVLDETGSMSTCKAQTIQHFNEYVSELKDRYPQALFTLTLFNSCNLRVAYNALPIQYVGQLNPDTYTPKCMTPLFDAIGRSIDALEDAVRQMEIAPDVLCVIITDGQENHSKEYSKEAIRTRISAKESAGWTFIYLGANQDAWSEGSEIGMSKGNTSDFSTSDMHHTFAKARTATRRYMSGERKNLLEDDPPVLSESQSYVLNSSHDCDCDVCE